jgi:hypothetical protein
LGEPSAPLRFLEFQKDHGRHREQERSHQHLADVDRGVGEKGEWHEFYDEGKADAEQAKVPHQPDVCHPAGDPEWSQYFRFCIPELDQCSKDKEIHDAEQFGCHR